MVKQPTSPKLPMSADSQDSGKDSTYSDVSLGSYDVPDLINFDTSICTDTTTNVTNKTSLLVDLDPFATSSRPAPSHQQSVVSTTSSDSLFSDAINSITSGLSISPDANSNVSPRQSLVSGNSPRQSTVLVTQTSVTTSSTCVRPRPRSARGSVDPPLVDFTSAPSSRPTTPSLSRQYTSSPTGSVQSLPQYPTYCQDDFGCLSDSSNNSSLLDFDPMFDDFNDNPVVTFTIDPENVLSKLRDAQLN